MLQICGRPKGGNCSTKPYEQSISGYGLVSSSLQALDGPPKPEACFGAIGVMSYARNTP